MVLNLHLLSRRLSDTKPRDKVPSTLPANLAFSHPVIVDDHIKGIVK
jgi:hypothetical protein